MSMPQWIPFNRNYDVESTKTALPSIPTLSNHPLLPKQAPTPVAAATTLSSSPKPNSGRVSVKNPLGASSDPLSMMAAGGDPLSDPLSAPTPTAAEDPLSTINKAAETKSQYIESSRKTAQEVHESNLTTPWQIRKQQILKDYKVSGSLSVSSSAYNEFSGSGVEDGSATRHLDKYTDRLASLERRMISSDMIELTQKEYEAHVQTLSADLDRAWANDERVGSLKIAIQLAKLLADTNNPQFYPTVFVLVTDVLDRFGDMVFNRLKGKAEEAINEAAGTAASKKKFTLPDDFTANDIPVSTKETCRNWFYKSACIRELLPRVYVEIALFKCYRFLTDTDMPAILTRLGSIIRGIGDPLVSCYARTYLVVVGKEVAPHLTQHVITLLQDILFSFSVLRDPLMIAQMEKSKISEKAFIYLLSPGIEWVLKCVGRNANKEVFQSILQMYREYSNDSMVLKHIIDCFDGSHYAHGALGMVTLTKSATISCFSAVDLFTSLGKQLSVYAPPEEQRLPLLNEVWKVVSKSTDVLSYIKCTAAWLDVVQKYYSEREMFVLLSSLAKRMRQFSADGGELSEAALTHLENLVSSLVSETSVFGTAVLTSEHLLTLLDGFKGMKKVGLCKDILESFKNQKSTSDAVLINTLFDLGRTVHDSVDCLSPMGDVWYVSNLLCAFIDKIDFGRDLEQQLNFYVECRGAFCNLDSIKDKLIHRVSGLAMKTLKFVKGKHSKKTSTFVKACLAYCHITIPSIADVFRRLELLLLCSQVALINQCLPQTDTFLKAAISLLPEMPSHFEEDGKRYHYEERLSGFLLSLLSTLVVTPGHPEHGPFYVVQGLLNAMTKFSWQPYTGVLPRVYCSIIALLCTFAQKRLPYHISGVESNDELYGNGQNYMIELTQHMNVCMEQILSLLAAYNERTEGSAKLNQSRCALDLINQISARMENNTDTGDFLLKLLELAARNKSLFTKAESKYFTNTVECVLANATTRHQLQNSENPGTSQTTLSAIRAMLK